MATIDGDITDWGARTRLDTPATGTAGYAFHGDLQADSFLFALGAEDVAIGAGTTIWLDSDLDRSTGHQIWGFAGGAEYNIELGADDSAMLYTGAAGETEVAELDYARSADGSGLEIALPRALLAGAPAAVRVFADVNDTAFLPNDYDNIDMFVGETAPPPPPDPDPEPVGSPGQRVGIVYSETTAANFYDKTAYGQLFMSAQNQAMQAGIPFDLLAESDLVSASGLEKYDALVLPTFSHVRATDADRIADTLAELQAEHGTGLIAGGNFMTNDETGAPMPGDSYARMKSLLGVTLEGYGETDGVELRATAVEHPILENHASDEIVGDYSNISYLYFEDTTGSGKALFDQVVSPAGGTETHPAVLATEVGAGRNIHFATDAMIGNNNILGSAIDWIAGENAPDVSLAMTRAESMFYARTDMDLSQEAWDVIEQDPGVYDAMLPIVEQWYEDYGFVGSYYINVGANPPDLRTDWDVSTPYYERLMALGSEIGSHSYTHPEDTNELLPDSPGILALVDKVDPRNPDAVAPSSLPQSEQELLFSSYRFQFETSKLIIEQRLGIELDGAAVPGAPERLPATREMIKFHDYLSGGYSGIGAGYPGAFGFLTPGENERPYLAPNMSFDFTLGEFQGLTPAEAEAAWTAEYDAIIQHANTPIIAFPWHDYGPTNWDGRDSEGYDYTQEMFTSVLGRAAADGTEFVTGADLAARIEAFADSELTAERDGQLVTATVSSDEVGHFALDLGSEGDIASVEDWFAWDGAVVFLPRDGGTFEVNLGATPADVTRIVDLPDRAELISVSGDGTELDASFVGRGEVSLALRSQDTETVQLTGADAGEVTSDGVTLSFADAGRHDLSVDYTGSGEAVAVTEGADMLLGGAAADTLDGGAGDDTLFGGDGVDVFAFHPGGGRDTILDFDSDLDLLELAGLGFTTPEDAYSQFGETDSGLELSFGEEAGVLLAGIDFTAFSANDIHVGSEMIA